MSQFDANQYFADKAAPAGAANDGVSQWDRLNDALATKQSKVAVAADEKRAALKARQQPGGSLSGFGMDSDYARKFTEVGVNSTGAVMGGIGDFINIGGQLVEKGLGKLGLDDEIQSANEALNSAGITAPSEWLQGLEDWMYEGGDQINQMQDPEFKKAVQGSTPTGDLTDPLSWRFGDDPSVEGYLGQAASLAGSFAPQAAAFMMRSPKAVSRAMATIGGLQAGGSQARDAEERIQNMSDEELQALDMFMELQDKKSMSEAEARDAVSDESGQAAFMGSAPIGAIGGAATAKILGPLRKKLGKTAAGRITGTTAVSAAEEGTQEVAEGVAARAASNAAIGDDQSLTAHTFTDAVLGAGFGGSLGLGSAAIKEPGEQLKAAGERQEVRNEEARQVDTKIAEAIIDGDYETLEDTESFPTERVAFALHKTAVNKKLPKKIRKASKKSLARLETKLNKQLDATEAQFAGATARGKEAVKSQMKRLKSLAKAARQTGDQDGLQRLKEEQTALKAKVRGAFDNAPDMKARVREKSAELQGALDVIRKRRSVLKSQEETDVDVDKLLQTATDANQGSDVRKSAGKRAVTLLMKDTSSLPDESVTALNESTGSLLDSQEQTYLKTLSKAAKARGKLTGTDGTTNDLLSEKGKDGFRSLPEYRSLVNAALEAGDTDSANEYLNELRSFAKRHRAKARLAKEAQAESRPGQQMALWSDPSSADGWVKRPGRGKADDALLRANGGLQFSQAPGSKKLAQRIAQEAQAIIATGKELSAAIEVAQRPDTATTQETTDAQTQADQRPEETEQSETTAQAEPEAPAAGESRTDAKPTEDAEVGANGDQTSTDTTSDVAEPVGDGRDSGQPESETAPGRSENDAGNESVTAYGLTFTPVKGQLAPDLLDSTNLVEAYFTVRKSIDDGRSKHPLTTRENFLSEILQPAVANNGTGLEPFVKDLDQAGDSQQVRYLKALTRFIEATNAKVADGFKKRTTDTSRRYDFLQFFADTEGNLPENVQTAISVAASQFVQDLAAKNRYNTRKQIASMVDRSSAEQVTGPEYDALYDKGSYESVIVHDLGRKAIEALGLKASKDAPNNHVAQLELALGHAALQALYRQEILIREGVRSEFLKEENATKTENRTSKPIHWFTRLARNEDGTPVDSAAELYDASKGSKSIGNKLFAVENETTGPVFEPPKMTQKTTKGRDENIPSEQKKILENEMATKQWTIRQDMKALVEQLELMLPGQSRELLARMAGAKDLTNYIVQATNKASVDGKNDALYREVDHLLDFYNREEFVDEPNKPFYFPLSVWVNQRVGMVSNTVNPLASKVHRFMLQMPEWSYTVPVKGAGKGISKKAQHNFRQFKLAVLEGLGAPVDKQTNERSLKHFDKEVKQAQPHIDTVTRLTTGQTVTPEEVSALADFVGRKEQFHTFDALVNLSRWQTAKKTGAGEFTSTLVREGDGITNGPALATILSGAWKSVDSGLTLVEKMGFFGKGAKHQSAGAWQEDDANNDLYQSLAVRVDELARKAYQRAMAEGKTKYASVFALMGSFTNKPQKRDEEVDGPRPVSDDGRKRVKTPLTAMAFGSGIGKAINSMGQEMVDLFFEQLEGALNSGKPDSDRLEDAQRLVKTLNPLLPKNAKAPIPTSLVQAQRLTLTSEQRNHAVAQFEITLGKHVKTALKEQFGDFIEFRDQMSRVASHSYSMFQLVRNFEKRKFLKELNIKTNKQGEPLQTLTARQEEELNARIRAAMPVMHTAMSKRSSELGAGLHMADIESQVQKDNPAFEVGSTFAQPIPVTGDTDVSWTDKKNRERVNNSGQRMSLKGFGRAHEYSDPGVRPFIMSVHALDSAIASRTYTNFQALNVHDAAIVAAPEIQTVAERMNQETLKALVNYSLPEAFMQTGYRVLRDFEGRLFEMEQDPEFRKAYKDALNGSIENVKGDLMGALRAADQAEANKLALLAALQTVNQYGVEGGEYTLTDADYTRIAERAKTTVSQRVLGDQALREQSLAEAAEPDIDESAGTEPAWGTVGTPVHTSDSALVSLLANNPNMKVRDLVAQLPRTKLTQALQKLVDPDIEIQYVTKDTPTDGMPDEDVSKAQGFWNFRNGVEKIYLKSPDFVESGLTPEMVTHEVLHSVLYHVVDDAQNGNGSRKAQKFTKELESLRRATQIYLDKPENAELKARWEQTNALDNEHELLAWGLSNPEFQELLSKVRYKTQNKKSLVKGLMAFVDAIKGMLFGQDAGKIKDTGLEAVIVNGAGLMHEAKQARTRTTEATAKQQDSVGNTAAQWTSEQVYDALASDRGTANDAQLREVLRTIVSTVHGPYGAWVANDGLATPAEVYTDAIVSGEMPFATEAGGVFHLTDQELFVLEQAEVSIEAALATDTTAYKALVRTFSRAKRSIDSSDLSNDPDQAQAQYDFLFDITQEPGENRTRHLSRFAALALVHPKVNAALEKSTAEGETFNSWFDSVTSRLGDRMNNTNAQQADNARILKLSQRLADIQAKRKAELSKERISAFDWFDDLSAIGQDAVAEKLTGVRSEDAKKRVEELVNSLANYRTNTQSERQNLLQSMFTEVLGATDKTQAFFKLLRMTGKNERDRKHIKDGTSRDIRRSFDALTDEESESITRVILRPDLSSLAEHYSQEDLEAMVRDPQRLQRAIKDWETQLQDLGYHTDYYLAYAKALGYHMTTGKVKVAHLNKNAYTLSRLYGVDNASVTEAEANAAEKVLDPLVSLYALSYTAESDRTRTSEVFRRENLRNEKSGMLYILLTHKASKEDALSTVFGGDKTFMAKGYTRELYNPHRDVTVVARSEMERYQAKGWVLVSDKLPRDPMERTDREDQVMMMMPYGGMQNRVTGSFSMTGKRSKGTSSLGEVSSLSRRNREKARMNRTGQHYIQSASAKGKNFEPANVREDFTAPIYDPQGNITDYRYLMEESTKDTVLDRDNRAEEVLGATLSNTFDKQVSPLQNQRVLDALHQMEMDEMTDHPERFIEVSAVSPDPVVQEDYRLLPEDVKRQLRGADGRRKLYVRRDVYNMIFGYRKYSLSSIWDKHSDYRNGFESAFVGVMEGLMDWLPQIGVDTTRAQAKMRVRQFEDAWQDIIRQIKDAWVIKNVFTLINNIGSNVSILVWQGVSLKNISQRHKEAVQGLLKYSKDQDELQTLARLDRVGLATSEQKQTMAELQDSMDRNPVKMLIDEGMFQTILEDVDTTDSDYSFTSRLRKRLDARTENVPKGVKTVTKNLFMTHDTAVYKTLSRATQMSDFVARYTLYQELVNRQDAPMDHETALQVISDTFINYDVPTHKAMQYLNDTGLVFFTKYYLRAQKVLWRLFRERGGRGISMVLLDQYFGGLPTFVEAGPNINNPMESGVLNYGEGLESIFPIYMLLKLW